MACWPAPPPTPGRSALVSCDNLPANGRRLRGLVTQSLAYAGTPHNVVDWVEAQVGFPGTMVDRIVPASTAQTLSAAQRALGVEDLAAVAAEPYTQWVIEDDFPGGRPAWDRAGAVLCADAGPWERLKLRALNGVHSATAYLGALAGCDTIAEALALPHLDTVLRRLIAEDVAASFVPPDGVDVVDYGEQVLARFGNPAIRHRTFQVAMDGSQKLPQRILHTVADLRAAGRPARWAALVVAAWIRFAQGSADDGRSLPSTTHWRSGSDRAGRRATDPGGCGGCHARPRRGRAARGGRRRAGPHRRDRLAHRPAPARGTRHLAGAR
ncbi:mannitol dehydrogenase family protein [Verrucosispora sioxanthis]|uniref:mannitol dehydrogenase family protein n=1 Tax=Verrucosispora sioxanthis TaxID=2499994 RepID=UPI002E2D4B48|nr:mannitol dehydrogenase family protein [Verrucosispora sioxanthis]